MRMHLVFHLLDYTPLSCIGAIDPAKLDHRRYAICVLNPTSYTMNVSEFQTIENTTFFLLYEITR